MTEFMDDHALVLFVVRVVCEPAVVHRRLVFRKIFFNQTVVADGGPGTRGRSKRDPYLCVSLSYKFEFDVGVLLPKMSFCFDSGLLLLAAAQKTTVKRAPVLPFFEVDDGSAHMTDDARSIH